MLKMPNLHSFIKWLKVTEKKLFLRSGRKISQIVYIPWPSRLFKTPPSYNGAFLWLASLWKIREGQQLALARCACWALCVSDDCVKKSAFCIYRLRSVQKMHSHAYKDICWAAHLSRGGVRGRRRSGNRGGGRGGARLGRPHGRCKN